MVEMLIGGAAIDKTGNPLPNETLDACRKADAVFLGAWVARNGILCRLANVRSLACSVCARGLACTSICVPSRCIEPLRGISPLRPDRLGDLDIEIVRELAGGMYFGERGNVTENGIERAFDTESYSTPEIERIAAFAYTRAEARSRKVCSVDKANVLSQFATVAPHRVGDGHGLSQREAGAHVRGQRGDAVTLRPTQFDVILSTNMFGDILSDAAAALVGSIGLIPSASFGSSAPLFEPIHGSAPSLVGKDVANPIGSILECDDDAARCVWTRAGSGLGGAIHRPCSWRRLSHHGYCASQMPRRFLARPSWKFLTRKCNAHLNTPKNMAGACRIWSAAALPPLLRFRMTGKVRAFGKFVHFANRSHDTFSHVAVAVLE